MKHFVFILLFSLIASTFAGASEPVTTEVYYFHKTRRCPTCMAIEKQTRKVLKEEPFASAIKDKKIVFKLLSQDNALNNNLKKELGVNGPAFIIVKGDKKIDLTNKAFLYALRYPEKFKQLLRETLK